MALTGRCCIGLLNRTYDAAPPRDTLAVPRWAGGLQSAMESSVPTTFLARIASVWPVAVVMAHLPLVHPLTESLRM
jgi:hypothetical protein